MNAQNNTQIASEASEERTFSFVYGSTVSHDIRIDQNVFGADVGSSERIQIEVLAHRWTAKAAELNNTHPKKW